MAARDLMMLDDLGPAMSLHCNQSRESWQGA